MKITAKLRRRVIGRIKSQAHDHYYASQANSDMNCGAALGDFIRGNDTERHALEYRRCLQRLKRIDKNFPEGALQIGSATR